MNATFRLRRSYFVLGVVSTLFFGLNALSGVLGICLEALLGRRAVVLAVELGILGFWLAWMALGVWIVLACRRHRLAVHDGQIDDFGVMGQKRMRVPEIVSARWRCGPVRGSLVLKTASTRLTIDLGNYENEEQRQLIRFFREAVPAPLQSGWELFYARNVKGRSRRARASGKDEPGEGQVLLTRRRLDRYFVVGLLLGVVASVCAYFATRDARVVWKLTVIPLIWLVVRFLLPRRGAVASRLTIDSRYRSTVFGCLWLFGGMACYLVMEALFPRAATAFMAPFFGIIVAGLFIGVWLIGRQQRRKEKEAIKELQRQGQLLPEEVAKPWS